jgi:hypothetical protein
MRRNRAGMLDRGADLEAVQDTHGAGPQQDAGADDDDLPRLGQRSHLLESTMEVAAPIANATRGAGTSNRRGHQSSTPLWPAAGLQG